MRPSTWPILVVGVGLVAMGCQRQGPETAAGPPPQATPRHPAEPEDAGCNQLPKVDELRGLLKGAPALGEAGGLAGGTKMWAAIVDRSGKLCGVVVSTDDPTDGWPGSRAIAMAKAFTANAFSTDTAPLSTARLYTLSQPGHSLWGAGAANPFDAACLAAPTEHGKVDHRVCGGTIVFGGGLALYRDKLKVGGLGVSGDTACTDHEIAKRVRDKAGLNPPSGGLADDITYSKSDGATVFTHPLCVNTWRNGQKIGDESPAFGY